MRRITVRGSVARALGALKAAVAAARSPSGVAPYVDPALQPDASPSGFNNWVARYDGKPRRINPAFLGGAVRTGPHPRIVVVIHVFYPELLDEIWKQLDAIPVPFDVILTNSSSIEVRIPDTPPSSMRTASIYRVPNRGRDILPLIHVVNAGLLDPYELVLKIHTKKASGEQGTLNSPETARRGVPASSRLFSATNRACDAF